MMTRNALKRSSSTLGQADDTSRPPALAIPKKPRTIRKKPIPESFAQSSSSSDSDSDVVEFSPSPAATATAAAAATAAVAAATTSAASKFLAMTSQAAAAAAHTAASQAAAAAVVARKRQPVVRKPRQTLKTTQQQATSSSLDDTLDIVVEAARLEAAAAEASTSTAQNNQQHLRSDEELARRLQKEYERELKAQEREQRAKEAKDLRLAQAIQQRENQAIILQQQQLQQQQQQQQLQLQQQQQQQQLQQYQLQQQQQQPQAAMAYPPQFQQPYAIPQNGNVNNVFVDNAQMFDARAINAAAADAVARGNEMAARAQAWAAGMVAPQQPQPAFMNAGTLLQQQHQQQQQQQQQQVAAVAQPGPSRRRPVHIDNLQNKFDLLSSFVYTKRGNGESEECIICFETYEPGATLVTNLACFHKFHTDCIKEWLNNKNETCPICKKNAITGE